MKILGLDMGSWADWFSGIFMAISVGYSIYTSRMASQLKLVFGATLSTNHNWVTERDVKYCLKLYVTNESPTEVGVLQTGFYYKIHFWDKKDKWNVSLSPGLFDESGETLPYGETKHFSFTYANIDVFPKNDMEIRVYPYVLLKNGNFVISKKGFKTNVKSFGYGRISSTNNSKK